MNGIAQQKYIFVPFYFPIISSPCNFFNLNILRAFNSADPFAAQVLLHIVKVLQPPELDYFW